MNALENNKLITEFMEADFENTLLVNGKCRYSESWDWLMPVVEKIETLGFLIHIDTIDGVKVFNPKTKDMIFVTFTAREYTSKIRETYKAVVEFIKWYNENKQ